MEGEQTPSGERSVTVKASSERPLDRGISACRARGGEEAVDLERQRILELAGDGQAGARDQLAHVAAVESVEVSHLSGALALALPSRREIGLEWHLNEHSPAYAGDLGDERRRIGHVLEHMGDDAEVVRASLSRQVSAVVDGDGIDLWPLARDRDGGLAYLYA